MAEVIGATELMQDFSLLRTRDVPSVLRNTINDVAREAKERNTERLPTVFENVSSFTQRAFYATRANKVDLEAFVGVKDKQARYLRVHERGGGRRHSRLEMRLIFAGVINPGEWVVKAEGAKLTKGTITQLLSQLGGLREGSASDSSRSRRARRRSGTFFIPGEPGVGKGSGLPRGIWRRKGIFIEPVLWITRKRPQYRPRLGFEQTTRELVRERFVSIARRNVVRIIQRNKKRGFT